MVRPEGWERLKVEARRDLPLTEIKNGIVDPYDNVFETGASAMLEALKKQGAWLNAGQTLCDLNNVAIIPYKSKGGWLVFIKEE